MSDLPRIELNDGASIPQLGFGVYLVPAEDAARVVGEALEIGYRSVDTAWGYFNEEGVGRAIRDSGLARDEIHVTTKVWNSYQGRRKTLESFEISMENLGLDRLDLLLVHWPAPANDLYVETWETFVELRESGRVTSIGVSNFEPEHLGRIIEATGVVPALNQVELHPYLQQRTVRDFHDLHGIATEAWGPIARGRVVDDPVLQRIGDAHGKSPVQVTLRWELQHGIVTIPKSEHRDRIAANFEVFDFELSPEEMAAIDGLDRGERTGPDPNAFS
jgi:diketogulonate reductase-like aldo/keto reductase